MQLLALNSPNSNILVNFSLKSFADPDSVPCYTVKYNNQILIDRSNLGLTLDNGDELFANLTLEDHQYHSNDSTWTPLYGEQAQIRDHYNAMIVSLVEKSGYKRQIQIEFRAFDHGVALRYILPKQAELQDFVIAAEKTQFHFPEGCYAYAEYGAEGEYEKVLVKDVRRDCERPLTVEYPSGIYLSLTEAKSSDYSRTLLQPNQENPWILESQLSGLIHDYVGYGGMTRNLTGYLASHEVKGTTPFATPWRVMIIGDNPGDLLEHNYIVLNLNDPCAIDDTSWIKPGKAMRDVTISTEGGKATVDFAAKHNFKYILLDAGWYGDPYDPDSDTTNLTGKVWSKINNGNHPGLDLLDLVAYAKQKDIGVFLYIDHRGVESQLDKFLPLYQKWGIAGIKIGFANVGPQAWTNWLVDVVRKCVEFNLLVNVHDAYRPTGLSRTYPNLLTQEGIRGNEHMPTANHNTTLPFTRMVAGAGDYTICYYTNRKQTTFTHQLALAVVIYSPLQLVFWYDKPSDYQNEVETDFFAKVPTVWDETKVIHGVIGEYATIARRSGKEWFIGSISNEEEHNLTFDLDFLVKGVDYRATIYQDDPNLNTRTNVKTHTCIVDSKTKLDFKLISSGGVAIHLIPC